MADNALIAHAPDGRGLTCAEWGDPAGYPVFYLHGTPESRLSRYPDEGVIRSAGTRMVTYDRPGYGGSDRHRGRTIAACAGDVAAIADALGITRFSVPAVVLAAAGSPVGRRVDPFARRIVYCPSLQHAGMPHERP
jgi:pimeloyl-ACP methyl ester carboxylesterase